MAPEPTEADMTLLEEITRDYKAAEDARRPYENAWREIENLWHGHKAFVRATNDASPRDKDSVINDGRSEFGADLHIPYAFSTVATILPRALSNRPRMLFLPRDDAAVQNVDNVRIVCDAQQGKANYELKLQTTFQTAFKLGTGVQKLFWRLDQKTRKKLVRAETGDWLAKEEPHVAWDDPDVDDVDMWDFFADPMGDSIPTCRYLFHRAWRDTPYVLEKLRPGEDGSPPAWDHTLLTPDDIASSGSKDKYKAAQRDRDAARGITQTWDPASDDVHEIWEYHTNRSIITILDRKWIVSLISHPYWHGELIFHAFRPVEVEHRFYGLGVVLPIAELIREMNWLRTDRRWNALLKMGAPIVYRDGAVDPRDVKFGPGVLIPANGEPRDMLHQMQVGDIPASGYQEEASMKADLDRTSGIDDTFTGGDPGGAQTATGVQLVQAAANVRVQFYTRRGELELIKPEAAQWLALNQQRIITAREYAVPAMPTPEEPDRFWEMRVVGPAEMQGEFEVEPEGGATAPQNVPQDRQDGMTLMNLFGQDPNVDPRALRLAVFKRFGFQRPETMLSTGQMVPPATLDILMEEMVKGGADPNEAHQLIAAALNAAMDKQNQSASGGGQASSVNGAVA